MTSSASGAAESWTAPPGLADEPAPTWPLDTGHPGFEPLTRDVPDESRWQPAPRSRLNDRNASAEGLSGRAVIALSAVATAACAGLDLALTSGRITFFFDLCFVVICLVAAMSVRRSDLFTAGVLPPLLFAAVIAVLSVVTPHAFESAPGVNKVFLTGLANHAAGLVFGYGVALCAVAARIVTSGTSRR